MATIDELSAIEDEEELKKKIEEGLRDGSVTQEVADAVMTAFKARSNPSFMTQLMSQPSQETAMAGMEDYINNPTLPEPTFLQQIQQQELDAMSAQALRGDPMPSDQMLRNRVLHNGMDYPVTGLRDDELFALADMGNEAAIAERANREEIAGQSFLEGLQNPQTFTRAGQQLAKGVGMMGLLPQGLLTLGATAVDAIPGVDVGADVIARSYDDNVRELERSLGIGPPLSPLESTAENLTANLPTLLGGPLAFGGAMLLDTGIEQTIRELTEQRGEPYRTIFDHIGLTDNNHDPVLNPLLAVGAAMAGGIITGSVLKRMQLPPAQARLISDFDVDGPQGLYTIETTNDFLKATTLDEQEALIDILTRAGVQNLGEVSHAINFDTHASMNTRVQQAMRSGQLSHNGSTFTSNVSPVDLFDAYRRLDPNTRGQIAEYLNLLDLRDDTAMAVQSGIRNQGHIQAIDQQLQSIVTSTPLAREFANNYRSIMGGLRDFAEGSLMTTAWRMTLDVDRPNYVPLHLSSVDQNANFVQRLNQARSAEQRGMTGESFLETRSIGAYDITRRQDPMELMLEYSEMLMKAKLENDTRLAIVDGLLNSNNPNQLIIRRTEDMPLKDDRRVITVRRDGVEEQYVTSLLTAQLARFDPYSLNGTAAALYIPKRVFEQTATGPLSVTFAPLTFLRDVIGGKVTYNREGNAPSIIGSVAAVPEILWAKSLEAVSAHFHSNLAQGRLALPSWMMDAQRQQRFADDVGRAFTQTLYHQANEAGGFDASIMRDRIQVAETMLNEAGRTIRDATEPLHNNAAARAALNMMGGFKNVFNAIQDAPRYSALSRNIRDGMDVSEATRLARQITGDTSRSGRLRQADGTLLDVDAVDQGVYNLAAHPVARGVNFVRETTPFTNPMIQGTRQLVSSFINDPVAFNMKAWATVGMPAVTAFGWNEMLGPEYNDYAMNGRSARDVVMNLYIGLPGRPPEEGIEIPLMHELMAWNAPFIRSLYGVSRGEDSNRTSEALSIVAQEILSNSVEIGFPTAAAAVFNMAGVNAPETILNPARDVYPLTEDYNGVLPINMEKLARTLFASVGDTALHAVNAFSGEMDPDDLMSQAYERIVTRTPIAHNVMGHQTANTNFSVNNTMLQNRYSALDRFREFYDDFYNPKNFNDDGVHRPTSRDYYTMSGWEHVEERVPEGSQVPYTDFGPGRASPPVNPLYEEFGQLLIDHAQNSQSGMTAVQDRVRKYNIFIGQLRNYNNGDATALEEWQSYVENIDHAEDLSTLELQRLIADYDLTKYTDRVRLLNVLEERKARMMSLQLDIYDEAEKMVTDILRNDGRLGPNDYFRIVDHLDPYDANPLGN